nr:immunoglobulin heavy chain junction region [Mus musculus]
CAIYSNYEGYFDVW